MMKMDKPIALALIIIDALAIIIGMVSGPFKYDEISLGASMAACIISTVIIVYGITLWNKKGN